MIMQRPVQRAIQQSAKQQGAGIVVGDIFPAFEGPDVSGQMINLDSDALAGRPRLVVLLRDPGAPEVKAALADLCVWSERFASLDMRVFVVAPVEVQAAKAWAEGLVLPFPVLCDPARAVSQRLAPSLARQDGPAIVSILLRPNRHVMAVLAEETPDHGDVASAFVETLADERKHRVVSGGVAPVLFVPDVFSSEDCQRLITTFALEGHDYVEPGDGDKGRTTDYKMRIPDYGRNDRIDHWVINPETTKFIAERLFARVAPVVRQTFHYPLTKYERFRIGRYQALDSAPGIIGAAHGHRDNTEKQVAHRRFACSVALNAEAHDGGGLVFPEFSGAEYAPRTGEALVFSSSVLHQVMPVTRGTRFVLLSFLFGDA
jgi:predicted 2-oxoglutarate/Fe(II)-dependent dioxygenase YbiX/peroxiredoxin